MKSWGLSALALNGRVLGAQSKVAVRMEEGEEQQKRVRFEGKKGAGSIGAGP